MITGFNTNVRYRGRVFHVQTEDSGHSRPHVISHVYHGGTILASEKREYAEHLGDEDLPGVVRRLMEDQHKVMVSRLKGGDYDALITERIAGAEAPSAGAPPADAAGEASTPRAFGEGLVSEQPLDEMILEYLVDKARDRGAVRPARPARSRE